jgi:hypothetical protein
MRNDILKIVRSQAAKKHTKRKPSFRAYGGQITTKPGLGKEGDIRVVKQQDGVKLNAKYGSEWYEVPLQRKSAVKHSWRTDFHWTADTSVTANTYHWLQLSGTKYTKALNTSLTATGIYPVNVDSELYSVSFTSNTTSASGVWGIKIYTYDKAGDITAVGNYVAVAEELTDTAQAVTQGKNYIFRVRAKFKVGSLMAVQVKAPATASFTNVVYKFSWKEYWR